MLNAARSALATLTAAERGTTVTVKRAVVTTSPLGGDELDWSSPKTVTTTTARVQPLNAERAERAGLQQLVNAYVFHLADVNLIPDTHRLYVGTTVYRVVRLDRWTDSHVEAICEVIDSG